MKPLVTRSSQCLMWLLMAFMVITCVKPPAGHFDFNLRMNELGCVLEGVNPFRVWNEEITLPPYVSNLPKKEVPTGCVEPVNAYAPWAYTYMMPFSFFQKPIAWSIYCVLMCFAILFLMYFTSFFKNSEFDRHGRVLLASIPFITVSYLLWSNVSVGNFIVFVLLFSVLMALALSRKRELLAGVFWALAMIKPQSAVLFAVPLLMRRRWSTCFVACGLCLAASLLPAYLCEESVVDLVFHGPAANAELFDGCGTWPKFLCGIFGERGDIISGLVVGMSLCLVMTWLLRKENDWLVYMMPAAVCASCWTYTQAYSHAMCWFLAYAIIKELLKNPKSRIMWLLMILAVPVLSRVVLAWHGLYVHMKWIFPISETAFRTLDSLNSTASMLLAFAYCIFKWRMSKCG